MVKRATTYDYKPSKPTTIQDWVNCGGQHEDQPFGAVEVAAGCDPGELFQAFAAAIGALCGPLRDSQRETWEEARDAVAAELGRRVDKVSALEAKVATLEQAAAVFEERTGPRSDR